MFDHINFNLPGIPSTLDESIDNLTAKLDLIGEKCHLKHGPKNMDIEIPNAVDYLCQYFGFNKERSITEMLRIPICRDCIAGLYDDDWALVYCINCNSSQWFYKPKVPHIEFHTDVVWLDKCPECEHNED